MYIANLNNSIKADYFGGENENGASKGGSEFNTLLNENIQGRDGRKKLMFLQSGFKYPLRPKLPDIQDANKQGVKISLQWQDGEITKNNEVHFSKEQQHGKNELMGDKANILKVLKEGKSELTENKANILKVLKEGKSELTENKANILKVLKDGKNELAEKKSNIHKILNTEKWSFPGKSALASKKDGWDIKKPSEGDSERNRPVDLFNVLGIKNSEASKGSDFNNSLNILKLDNVENINAKNLVGKITDYLIQNGIKKLDFLEVVVDHEDLGRFKIDVQKNGRQGLIDLKIEVMTAEGKDFFQQNEALLAKSLNNAGINVQDLKIVDFKDNIMLNSFSLKNDNNMTFNLEKDIYNEENNESQHKKDERNRRSKEEHMNEEENNAEYW